MIVISNQLVDDTNHQIIRELRCWYHIILLRYTYLNQWRWSNELTRVTKRKINQTVLSMKLLNDFFRRRKLLFKLKRLYNMRVTNSRIRISLTNKSSEERTCTSHELRIICMSQEGPTLNNWKCLSIQATNFNQLRVLSRYNLATNIKTNHFIHYLRRIPTPSDHVQGQFTITLIIRKHQN